MKFTQIIKEAAYSWIQRNDHTIAFKAKSGGTPSLVVSASDGGSLMTSEKMLVIIIKTRTLEAYLKDAEKNHIYKQFHDLTKCYTAIRRITGITEVAPLMMEYPEFFKVKEVSGRGEIYRHLTVDLKMPQKSWETYFGYVPEVAEDAYTAFHNAKVFFPTGTREKRKEALLSVLEPVYNYLAGHKLQDVFRGTVRFIRLRPGVVGQYDPRTKDLDVSPNANHTAQVTFTLLHELGHKHFFEFLPQATRDAIKDKFLELRHSEEFNQMDTKTALNQQKISELIQPGSILGFTGKNRMMKKFHYFKVDSIKGDDVKIVPPGDLPYIVNNKRWISATVPANLLFGGDWTLVDPHTRKETPIGQMSKMDIRSDNWFPTDYSKKNHTEWYAECFAFFCIGNLDGPVKDFFAKIMRS